MLPHAFVVARLLPSPSSAWTSACGAKLAETLETREFAALRIHLHPETGLNETYPPFKSKGLFLVSHHKPPAPYEDFYLPLTAGDRKESLKLNHQLSSGKGPLYLHIYPLIYEYSAQSECGDEPNGLIRPSFHQLDAGSYARVIRFFRDSSPPRVPPRLSGGAELVEAGWATFSGHPKYEQPYESPGEGFVFRISPYTGSVDTASVLPGIPDIWPELVVLTRLQEEYSWNGIMRTIDWLADLRHFSGTIFPFVASARPYHGHVPALTDEMSRSLSLLSASFDSYLPPPPVDDDSADGSWDSPPPIPNFECVPSFTTVEPRERRIRAIVFDVCGSILDFASATRDALSHLGVPEGSMQPWVARLCELHARESQSHKAPYGETARRALKAVSMLLPGISKARLRTATQIYTRPKMIVGIQNSLGELRSRGFHLFGYFTLDTASYQSLVQPAISSLPMTVISQLPDTHDTFSPCTNLDMRHILDCIRSRGLVNIASEQIVLVSPSSFRALEPATIASITTALLILPEHPEVRSASNLFTASSTMVVEPHNMATIIDDPATWKRSTPRGEGPQYDWRVNRIYQIVHVPWPHAEYGATVTRALCWLTGQYVVVKYELPPSDTFPSATRHEAGMYKQLQGSAAIPRIHWSGSDGGADVLVMDLLGPTLEELRLAHRGVLSLKSVLMIGIQMLDFIEFAHARGVILRDIKPQNAAVGFEPEATGLIHNFDFGNAKMYVDVHRGVHLPLRKGRKICGTVRFCTHWAHQGLESSRRDDIVQLGHMLLYLLHGRLPWQGIFAPSLEAKLARMGEMKSPENPAMIAFLAHSPAALSELMRHAHRLHYSEKPDYPLLRTLLEREMYERGWIMDGDFDWSRPPSTSAGTLIPWEYKFIYEPGSVPPSLRPRYDSAGNFRADSS